MRGSAAFRAAVAPGGVLAGPWVRNELWRRARAVPSLDLRFADNKSLVDATTGANLVTFTRASSGTFVDSQGVIQSASTDVPRFDHNPTTGESLGLLVEESRTNLFLQSNGFDTTWTNSNSSETAAAGTAPDGTITAWELKDTVDAVSTIHSVQQAAIPVTSGTSYTLSVFAKAGTLPSVGLRFAAAGFTAVSASRFNLSTGSVASTGANSTASITAYPDGWYRCSMTMTATSTTNATFNITTGTTNLLSYIGDGTGTIFIWGAQLEAGAFPTSYIPTTSATVTRSADVASISGSNFSSWYRQDEGTVFATAARATTPASTVWFATVNDGTFNNRIQFGYGDSSGNYAILVSNSVTGQAYPAVSSTTRSAGFSYGGSGGVSYNGATTSSVTITSVPTVNQMSIGSFVTAGSGYLNGTIRRLVYWGQRLPNSTLQAITQ